MLTPSKTDRDFAKFRDAGNNLTKVAVSIEQDSGSPVPVTVSGGENSKIAGETVSAVKVVYLDSGSVYLADSSIEAKASAFGISETGSASGGSVVISESGEYYDSSLSFTVGQPVFLTTAGSMSQTPPVSGFLVLLGYAIAVNGININIQEKIQL